MDVRLLRPDDEGAYQALVSSAPESLIYVSLAYREFLDESLPHARPTYLVAEESGRLVGAMPAFVGEHPVHGRVMNSLPFFGSHGGVLVAPDVADATAVKRALLRGFNDVAAEEGVRASTVISSPFETGEEIYAEELRPTHQDSRIGQFTLLPAGLDDEALAERLMEGFHQKTRNMVRKGLKGGFSLRRSDAADDLAWLQQVHEQNMVAVGATPKPLGILRALARHFNSSHCIYIAELESERVAGLLVLYFNGRAEYYMPAIVERFRSGQALSALIFHAMQDAVRRGAREWNWGGTAPSQESIYRFKTRWNAVDRPYRYYINLRDPSLADAGMGALAAAFPYFYLFPFRKA